MLFRPHNYRPGQKYPTVLNIYGGPEVQLVTNTFKVTRYFSQKSFATDSVIYRDSDNCGFICLRP